LKINSLGEHTQTERKQCDLVIYTSDGRGCGGHRRKGEVTSLVTKINGIQRLTHRDAQKDRRTDKQRDGKVIS
jgi:hypothetical protein